MLDQEDVDDVARIYSRKILDSLFDLKNDELAGVINHIFLEQYS